MADVGEVFIKNRLIPSRKLILNVIHLKLIPITSFPHPIFNSALYVEAIDGSGEVTDVKPS